MIRRSIRLTFGAKAQPGITLQRGDCFSTAICAQCYAPNGCPVSFEGRTVHVVYQTGGQSSPGYEVEARDNVLTWTLPPCAAQTAGPGKMQLMVYGADSLLHSAVIPYTVLDSLEPGEGGEDPVPALVLLLDKAQAAISGANAAAQAAAQVAAEVQSRLDSGAFIGPPGLDAPQIDDTQITTTNPWSSMQIVKTLCPPFTASGSVVQCTPVENSPLDVQVEITPMQEGEGDPSPDNIRPITGMDEVQVTRCGKNLAITQPVIVDYEIQTVLDFGCDVHINTITISFTCKNLTMQATGAACVDLIQSDGTHTYKVWSAFKINGAPIAASGNSDGTAVLSMTDIDFCQINVYWMRGSYSILGDDTELSDFMVNLGDTPLPYAPYTGTTATLTLPETIYGGTVDAVTGEGVETWLYHLLTSSNTTTSMLEANSNETSVLFGISRINGELISNQYGGTESWVCSHLPSLAIVAASSIDNGINGNRDGNMFYIRLNREIANDIQEFLGWLDAQSAAGTPVQVAYKLATPTAFQATGGQSIPALPGTNTVYTDADTVTVSGLSDPVSTIASLQARVSALESAQTNM